MKLMHLSDLHLGKRVNEISMLEDQKYILTRIINIIDEEQPDGILIAGDVYDKSVPITQAVELFDDFLSRLAARHLQVFIISGNHDSSERLAFGNKLMDVSGIHFSPIYKGTVTPFTLEDAHGKVDIFMLPFLKPSHVRAWYPEENTDTYTAAMETAIRHLPMDENHRSVLVAHQFVTGATTSESEEISVGGTDNVDAHVFAPFDYVALGHIHGPQHIGSEKIRYCGTPLKYSFSEAKHKKSVTMVELGAKGELTVRTVPLVPVRDMVEIKGTFDELTQKEFYEGTSYQEDYMHITLTDEEDVPDAIAKLRLIYHNVMKLDYDNARTRHNAQITGARNVEQMSPVALFGELYELQNGVAMTDEQLAFVKELVEKIWEGEQ